MIVFDTAAENEDWGNGSYEYRGDMDSPYYQPLLSLGLRRIFWLCCPVSHEPARALLMTRAVAPSTKFFLYEALNTSAQHYWHYENLLCDVLADRYLTAVLLTKPFFNDPDSGPYDIWRAVHTDNSLADMVNQRETEMEREWGYVF